MAIRITLEYGHTSMLSATKWKYDWEIFVRGVDNADIHHYIEKVEFHLYPEYNIPTVLKNFKNIVLKEPPFVVKESGNSSFVVSINIYLKNKDEPKKFYIFHLHAEDPTNPTNTVKHHTEIILNPSDEFGKKLLKGGATLCEDSNTMVLNDQLFLEDTHSADKIQQSASIQENQSHTDSDSLASSYDSRTSTKTIAFPSTSSSSSEKTHTLETGEDSVFAKHGSKEKKTIFMKEAVEALKKISEKMPEILESRTPNTADACEHLGLFIAARLREMDPKTRMYYEREIMKILTTVSSIIETREKNT